MMDPSPPEHGPQQARGEAVEPPAPSRRALPPPLPARYRYRRRRRLGPLLIILSVLVGVMGSLAIVASIWIDQPKRTHSATGAELFVERICLGDAGEPGEENDPDALCGYAKAYDMLAAEVRAELSYASFCEDFEIIRDRSGPVQRIEQREHFRVKRQRLVRYRYDLSLGDPESDLEELKVYSLELTLKWVEERWLVTAYRIRPATQIEMR